MEAPERRYYFPQTRPQQGSMNYETCSNVLAISECGSSRQNGSMPREPLRTIPTHAQSTAEGLDYKQRLPETAPMDSFELEDNNTAGSGGTSWTLRIPWLGSKRHKKLQLEDENSSVQTNRSSLHNKNLATGAEDYYGGLMKTAIPNNNSSFSVGNINTPVDAGGLSYTTYENQTPHQLATVSAKKKVKTLGRKHRESSPQYYVAEMDQGLLPQNSREVPPPSSPNTVPDETNMIVPPRTIQHSKKTTTSAARNLFSRSRSWLSTTFSRGSGNRQPEMSASSDVDSLADFDETEWTPPDSSYGAAIPICGWVPKRLRQGIEATLIALTAFVVVYLIVTTSISVQENKTTSGKRVAHNDSFVYPQFDDDWYVEYNQIQNDEDDYFNNDHDGESGNNNDGNHDR